MKLKKNKKKFCLVCVTTRQKSFEKFFFEEKEKALEKFESLVQQWRARDRAERGPYELIQLFEDGRILCSRAMPWLNCGVANAWFATPRITNDEWRTTYRRKRS